MRDPRVLRPQAYVWAITLVLLAGCGTQPPQPPPVVAAGPELTERSLTEYTGWWWLSNATAEMVEERIAAGFRIIDLEVLDTDPWRFSVAMVADAGVHEKDWWWYYGEDVTSAVVADMIAEHDARIIDIEVVEIDGQRRYAVVLVPNTGAEQVAWWYLLHTDLDTISAAVSTHSARIVDLDSYVVDGTRYWNAVMYDNTGDHHQTWWWYYGVGVDFLVDAVDQHGARVTVLERLGPDTYAAVMVENPGVGWRWFFGLTAGQVGSLANLYSVRLIDVEPRQTDDGLRYDVVMLQNGFHCEFPEQGTSDPVSENEIIDRAVQAEMCDQNLVGLAVGIVHDGRIVYLKGYGFEDAEERVPVQAKQSMFRWASVSKSVTGLAAVQSWLQDGLSLDSDVRFLVPEYEMPDAFVFDLNDGEGDPSWGALPLPPDTVISTRMLVSNLSGIKHYSNSMTTGGTPPAALRNDPTVHTDLLWAGPYFWDDPAHLVAIPRSVYSYSSFAFNLAGMAIARAGSGVPMTYWEKVRDRIAVPFGMTPSAAAAPDYPPDGFVSGTFFQPDHEWVDIPRRAVGYRLETVQVDDETVETGAILQSGSSDVSWKAPSGGFISSIEHMAQFCNGVMNHPSVTDDMREVLWEPQPLLDGTVSDGYGLGFSLGERNGRTLMSHNGAQQKVKTNMYIYPDDNMCFVVMTNSEWASSGALVQALEDAYRSTLP